MMVFELNNYWFKYSVNPKDYTRCKKCDSFGIHDSIKCICGQVIYCSKACLENDTKH